MRSYFKQIRKLVADSEMRAASKDALAANEKKLRRMWTSCGEQRCARGGWKTDCVPSTDKEIRDSDEGVPVEDKEVPVAKITCLYRSGSCLRRMGMRWRDTGACMWRMTVCLRQALLLKLSHN